jgi:esterase FrsA
MPFHWDVETEMIFTARYPQMVNLGLPSTDVDAVRGTVTDMWQDEPGGWVHEWSALGASYSARGEHDRAALAYGWAKFPAITDDAKRVARDEQLAQYLLAVPDLPIDFERRIVDVPFRGATTPTPVHIIAAPGLPDDTPVVLATGGADSWKIDVHDMLVGLAMNTGARVVAFDLPGTGESQLALTPESVEIIDGLVPVAREMGDGRVIHFGLSLGGYFSAYSGLSGIVDASVDFGGPVEEAFAPGTPWAEGFSGILGNLLGFDEEVGLAALDEVMGPFSLRSLLERPSHTPMFVINGENDVLIPQHDSLVFQGRGSTEVLLMADTAHCATSKFDEAMEHVCTWITHRLLATSVDAS